MNINEAINTLDDPGHFLNKHDINILEWTKAIEILLDFVKSQRWRPIEQLKKDKPLDFICYFPHEKVKIQTGWTNGKGSTVIGGMFEYDMTSQPSHFMIVNEPTQE